MIMLISFMSLIFALLCFVSWHHHMKAREIAITLAKKLCDEAHVQLLDESITLQHFRLGGIIGEIKRNKESGWLCLKREYQFEYSEEGHIRRRGRIILLGHTIILARLDSLPLQPTQTFEKNTSAEIIKFNQFKKYRNPVNSMPPPEN